MSDMDDRVKTDFRLPKKLVKEVHKQCRKLGIPRNSYALLALWAQVAQLAAIVESPKKRQALLTDVGKRFQKALADLGE